MDDPEAPNLPDYLRWRITTTASYISQLANKTHPELLATRERCQMELPLIRSVQDALLHGYPQGKMPDYLAIWYTYLNLCAWTYAALTDYHHDATAHRARVQLLHARDTALDDLIYQRTREAI